MSRADAVFAGSVPQIYEEYLVPLLFEPYAADLAGRTALREPARVLEIAAGTGAVTRQLAKQLPSSVSIEATDLNPAMLAQAAAAGSARPVAWRQADAMKLPYADAWFDAVVCQFGAMFFPDKGRAFAEARRVLRPGGAFLFNVWDGIEANEFADTVTQALAAEFPDDPPLFLVRTPHGYGDTATVARDLVSGGFERQAEIETLAARSRTASPRVPALAFCQGTPLRGEIEVRGSLAAATDAAEAALARRFGTGAIAGGMRAHVICVER